MPQSITQQDLAEKLYIAYATYTDWRDMSTGGKLEPWASLQNTEKGGWMAAAQVALEAQENVLQADPKPLPIGTKQILPTKDISDHRREGRSDSQARQHMQDMAFAEQPQPAHASGPMEDPAVDKQKLIDEKHDREVKARQASQRGQALPNQAGIGGIQESKPGPGNDDKPKPLHTSPVPQTPIVPATGVPPTKS